MLHSLFSSAVCCCCSAHLHLLLQRLLQLVSVLCPAYYSCLLCVAFLKRCSYPRIHLQALKAPEFIKVVVKQLLDTRSLHTILIIVTSSNLQSAIHTPTYTICTSFEYIRFKSVILLIPKYAVHLVIYLVTFICFVQFEVISAPYINILLTAPNYYSKLLQYADLHFCLCLLPHGKRKMFLHRFFLTGRV